MEDQIKELCNKLDKLIALIAIQGKNPEEQIRTLRILEYKNSDIVDYTGIPLRTVVRRIGELKKIKKIKN